MSDSKLTAADLAKLAEGATIYGPWRALENGIETGDRYDKQRGFAMWMDHGTPQDRALIVYLVNHVPEILALLGENERLRNENARLRDALTPFAMTAGVFGRWNSGERTAMPTMSCDAAAFWKAQEEYERWLDSDRAAP